MVTGVNVYTNIHNFTHLPVQMKVCHLQLQKLKKKPKQNPYLLCCNIHLSKIRCIVSLSSLALSI